MAINIRGKNLEVTEALDQYINQKIGRINGYFDPSEEPQVNVTISVIRDQHIVEVNAALEDQHIRAQAQSNDMYSSIDLVEEKVERQIRKYKTRFNRKVRKVDPKNEVLYVNSDLNDEEDYEVVRIKRFDLKPMDTEEAILQMNMLGHQFFVYRDSVTGRMNVVYNRHDGKYGRIEAE